MPALSYRIFTCAACGEIVRGKRHHAITCGAACRVRLHRQPEVRARLEADSLALGLTVAHLLERRALAAMHPDLAARVDAGEIGIDAVRAELFKRTLQDLFRRLKRRAAAN
ncbi:MAG: hypothetical protein ACREPY_09075 [Rhodanobacteraceae bacterium]